MESWWDTLNVELRIFYGIGILSLFSLALQVVMALFSGLGHDHEMTGHDADHSSGLGLFSIRGITAFFLGFGWTGVIALKAGWGLLGAIAAGIFVGFGLMVAIFFLLRTLLGLQSSGTLNYQNAVGLIGTAYTTIPADQKAGGQVEVLFQGRLTMAEALYRGQQPITPGTKVKIIDKMGHATLMVEPLDR